MEARSHHAYQEENKWLHYTLEYIEKTTLSHIHKKENIDNTVRTTLKHFDSANSEDYITLMVNTLLKDRMDILLKNLVKAKSKPYFARVDFLEDRACYSLWSSSEYPQDFRRKRNGSGNSS